MSGKIHVMIIDDSVGGVGLEFRMIEDTVRSFQENVGCEYLQGFPGGDWAVYLDENQDQGNTNVHASRVLNRLNPGVRSALRGRCMFVGTTGSMEINVPDSVIDLTLIELPTPPPGVLTICLYRFGNKIHVYDDQATAVKGLLETIEDHRTVHHNIPIEAYFGIPPTRWVEIRVEMMDHFMLDLYDHRNDRSYG